MPDPNLQHGEALAWLKAQPDHSVDAIITDPPYGLGLYYNGVREEYRKSWTYGPWIREVYKECRRVVALRGVVIVNQSRVYVGHMGIWFDEADQFVLVKSHVAYHGWRVSFGYNPLMVWEDKDYYPPEPDPALMVPPRYVEATRTDVIHADCSRPIRSTLRGEHPYPFPYDAAVTLVTRYTQPGQLVVDPFMGSGTIPLAARNTGRRYLGLDRERAFVALAQRVFAETSVTTTPTTTTGAMHDQTTRPAARRLDERPLLAIAEAAGTADVGGGGGQAAALQPGLLQSLRARGEIRGRPQRPEVLLHGRRDDGVSEVRDGAPGQAWLPPPPAEDDAVDAAAAERLWLRFHLVA
jgi:hypothetical protein